MWYIVNKLYHNSDCKGCLVFLGRLLVHPDSNINPAIILHNRTDEFLLLLKLAEDSVSW